MPELPEVETVRTGLEGALVGAKIKKVLLRRANLRIPFPEGFAETLTGATITAITRRAKYLVFHFDGETVLIAHLGMSGDFSVEQGAPKTYGAHDHVVFTFDDGRVAIFNDPRRFGLMALCEGGRLNEHPLFAHLGPEPLSKDFSVAYLKAALAKRNAPIKPTLMDQKIVVGVGNIYASEALFMAGISPLTPANIAAKKSKLIIECIQKVLSAAIVSGGSSLRDFLHVSGEAGYFQHHFNVYDREGEPCYTCHTPIIAIRQAGRSTFYCGKCQG